MFRQAIYLILGVILLFGCSAEYEKEPLRFVPINAEHSQINFQNTIIENDSINVIDFQYCYNGGGVGVGDFNNDGLPDLVFTGNQVSSTLYLNQGNLKFLDISKKAKFDSSAWVTGVSIVDINQDGFEDIYLSVGGPNCKGNCNNLMFINQGLKNGIPFFEEMASSYGLEDGGYTQQTIFFDYDEDGDLDAYQVHNGNSKFDKNAPLPKRYLPNDIKDRLLRNDLSTSKDHPFFTDVSKESGVDHAGFGLGVGLSDFNKDGLPDIYVANDFLTDDLLYINKGIDSLSGQHRGFAEKSKDYLAHQTYNAMGVDIGDINNDDEPDIMVLDMLPNEYKRQKKMLGMMNYNKYLMSVENGYDSQYMHNTLQLGKGMLNDKPIKKSEIGFLAGISSTDWSWAPLMADFDNDGDKDIYITNGYVKDITDLDFINFSDQNNMFGSSEARDNRVREFLKGLPGVNISNFIYENTGKIEFNDVSALWTTAQPSFSNGAAYADLDNDGDLDLIVNNINEKAFLLENKTSQNSNTNFLRIELKGDRQNAKAIGAKITLHQNGISQQQYQSVIRGYLSSVEPIIHFGVQDTLIDSLVVKWPNGKTTLKYNVQANQVLKLDVSEAVESKVLSKATAYLFQEKSELLNYKQDDVGLNEYTFQHLLMRQYTSQSSCIVAADVDGVAGDEIFIGGAKGKPGSIWFQDANGVYIPKQFLDADYDDSQADFVDVDSDGDLDMYIGSGGNRFDKKAVNYQDRVYLNDGNGFFVKSENILPMSLQSTSTLAKADFDKDGDFDFFVGSRLTPKEYPSIPESTFLVNNNGVFNKEFQTLFSELGMVTSATWADIDNDSWLDLIVVGEFMEITIFKNSGGHLQPMATKWVNTNDKEINTSGWWNTIAASDFDHDGDIDFIIGNQGANSVLKPTQAKPIYVYTKDFDQNGSLDPILAKFFDTPKGKTLLPVHTRDDIMKQLPVLKNTFTSYEAFANANFEELLNIKDLSAETLKATVFESSYAVNLGNGKFKLIPLPIECQVAPINAVIIEDFDADKQLDFLIVGNDKTAETHYGNQDALSGVFMKGNNGFFEVVESNTSGFYVPEQVNHFVKIKGRNGQELYVATQYNNVTKVFIKN